jgi:hypothetical protein
MTAKVRLDLVISEGYLPSRDQKCRAGPREVGVEPGLDCPLFQS